MHRDYINIRIYLRNTLPKLKCTKIFNLYTATLMTHGKKQI